MKKIITAVQTRAADLFTIAHEPISSIDLMERAAQAFVDIFEQDVNHSQKILVVCGVGDNGGDGLAITRLLNQKGYSIQAIMVRFSAHLSQNAQINLERLDSDRVTQLQKASLLELTKVDVIVDGLFGSGLNRPVRGLPAEVILALNKSGKPIYSIDLPSGIRADTVEEIEVKIKATKTITFQRPKLTFMLPETGAFVNEWEVADIGLSEAFIEAQDSPYQYQGVDQLRIKLPKREKFEHKGDFGRVQVFAGELGKMGAAYLCAKGVLRTGAGLVTVHVPQVGYNIMQTSLPEAMVTVDGQKEFITDGRILDATNVACIGPGIGQHELTRQWLIEVLRTVVCPVVLDADALNLLATLKKGYAILPPHCVITPHVKEFDRLFGRHDSSLQRLKTMRSVSLEKKLVIVLKGAHSAVSLPSGQVVFNTTGNVGMATAGSGDVLSGIVTGLMAQGLVPADAALIGVMIHGMAGDLAEKKLGKMSLMASDLLNELPSVLKNVT